MILIRSASLVGLLVFVYVDSPCLVAQRNAPIPKPVDAKTAIPAIHSESDDTAASPPALIQIDVMLILTATSDTKGDREKSIAALLGNADEIQDRIKNMKSKGLSVKDQIRLTTLAGHPAEINSGAQTPRATGASTTRSGQKVYNYQDVSTGVQFSATPEIENDRIMIKLDLSRSYLDQSRQPSEEEESVFLPQVISTLTNRTTVAVNDNQSIAYGITESASGHFWIVVVSARQVD